MSTPVLTIERSRGWRHVRLDEIWQYRELLGVLAMRDVRVRYKQTAIGVAWAVLQPLLTMIVFSVFFGRFAKMPSDGIPYPVFVFAGLLPWQMFSQGLTRSAESLTANVELVKKIYFPRIIIPLAATLSALVDFCCAFVVLAALMFCYGVAPTAAMAWFPALLLLTLFCSVGVGFWLSAVNVLYRDVRYTIPFMIQLGLFVTPVIYPVSLLPERWAWVMYFNPMAGIIEGFRAALLGHQPLPLAGLVFSAVISGMFLISGLVFFRRMERVFADVI